MADIDTEAPAGQSDVADFSRPQDEDAPYGDDALRAREPGGDSLISEDA